MIIAGVVALALGRFWLADWGQSHPAARAWVTALVSITLQSLPFLLLGVTLGAVISVLVPAR
ncbi:hypothetical protein [Kineosporia sp. NBRC 101731]|uniref:hypothetical protein n=1 Tax=Kineosporia sp. NBRC 101731 TaxID=3032199 RepID=UPI0024A161E8|nr:hypothetical protein [Kineosporia sp. NBRC 101731]GLY32377.1 hypothetical protein Kisp02_57420 [Kineosporia sp. NBRC 101731]